MPSEFSVQQCRADLIRVVEAVFKTTLGLDVVPGELRLRDEAGRWRAAVNFRGSWNGALLLELGPREALDFTRIMFPWQSNVPAEGDIRDAIGELANMLAGNLKSVLPRSVSLSSPVVGTIAEEAWPPSGSDAAVTLAFASLHGPFSLSVRNKAE